MKLPVLLTAYSRTESLQRVLEAVNRYQPSVLYIHIDGPSNRSHTENHEVFTLLERWEPDGFEVIMMKESENLGCSDSMLKAIDWFFSAEECGVILEDDCLPSDEFFWLSELFLAAFFEEKKVWGFGGDNSIKATWIGGSDLAFTSYPLIWGWASWADRWRSFRKNWPLEDEEVRQSMATYPSGLIENAIFRGPPGSSQARTDSWDFAWSGFVRGSGGIWGVPRKNLISNLGFDQLATNTRKHGFRSSARIQQLPKKRAIRFPKKIEASSALDLWVLISAHKVGRVLIGSAIRKLEGLIKPARSNIILDK